MRTHDTRVVNEPWGASMSGGWMILQQEVINVRITPRNVETWTSTSPITQAVYSYRHSYSCVLCWIVLRTLYSYFLNFIMNEITQTVLSLKFKHLKSQPQLPKDKVLTRNLCHKTIYQETVPFFNPFPIIYKTASNHPCLFTYIHH